MKDHDPINPSSSNPSASPISPPSSKDKKKDEKELLAQTATLLMLEETMRSVTGMLKAGSTAPISHPNPTDGPSQEDFVKALGLCAAILNMLQTTDAQGRQAQAENSASISKDTMAMMQEQLAQQQKALQQLIQQQQAEASSQSHQAWWQKLIEAFTFIAAIVTTAFSFGAGVAMLTLAILQYTGAMQKITSGISASLQKDGLPAEKADIMADVIVTAICIVATMGAAGASLASVAEDAESLLQKIGSSMKSFAEKAFASKTAVYAGLEGFGTGVGSTNLIQDIGSYIINNDLPGIANDPKKKEEATIILSVLAAVVAAIYMVAGGTGLATSATDAEKAASLANQLGKKASKAVADAVSPITQPLASAVSKAGNNVFELFSELTPQQLKSFMKALVAKFGARTAYRVRVVLTIIRNYGAEFASKGAQGGASVGSGISLKQGGDIEVAQAATQEVLGNLQAAMLISQMLMNNIQGTSQSQAQNDVSMQKAHAQELQAIFDETGISGSALSNAIMNGVV